MKTPWYGVKRGHRRRVRAAKILRGGQPSYTFRRSLWSNGRSHCLAVDQNRERWQIWCKHSSGERARIQFRKFPGGGERGVRHSYQAEQ